MLTLLRRSVGDRGRIVVRGKGKLVFIQTSQIEWVEAAGNYVQVHAAERTHSVRGKISSFEELLPRERFLRIHGSVIVNIDAIAEVQICGAGEYVAILRGGRDLPIGRSYRESLESIRSIP